MDIPMPPVLQARSMADYMKEYADANSSVQQNQMNALKLQRAPQDFAMKDRTDQLELDSGETKQTQQKVMLGSGMAKAVLTQSNAQAKAQGIPEGSPEYDQIVNQVGHIYAPHLSKVFGKPYDPNTPIDINAIRTLAAYDSEPKHSQADIDYEVAKQKALFPMNLELAGARADATRPPVSWSSAQDGAYQVNPQTGETRQTGLPPKQAEPKPLLDWQRKNIDFSTRMIEANDVITKIGKDYDPNATTIAKSMEGVPLAGWAANKAISANDRQIIQAQRQFANSVLRPETGASISDQEFENTQKQYFPQPNDDDETLANKQNARETAIRGLQVGIPPEYLQQRTMPVGNENIQIDMKHPENLTAEDRAALQADVDKEKAKPKGKLKFLGFE
jgi:hypothetical protein